MTEEHAGTCECQSCERRLKWDLRYMHLAREVSKWSKDPSTQVGAVLIGLDPRDLAVGYNGFPPGIRDDLDRLYDRGTKYLLMQHAERNVLDNAKFSTRGATLISTAYPCVDCAKSIVSKGIARVVTTPMPPPLGVPTWRDTLIWSRRMFAEAGIEVCEILGEDHAKKA